MPYVYDKTKGKSCKNIQKLREHDALSLLTVGENPHQTGGKIYEHEWNINAPQTLHFCPHAF